VEYSTKEGERRGRGRRRRGRRRRGRRRRGRRLSSSWMNRYR